MTINRSTRLIEQEIKGFHKVFKSPCQYSNGRNFKDCSIIATGFPDARFSKLKNIPLAMIRKVKLISAKNILVIGGLFLETLYVLICIFFGYDFNKDKKRKNMSKDLEHLVGHLKYITFKRLTLFHFPDYGLRQSPRAWIGGGSLRSYNKCSCI